MKVREWEEMRRGVAERGREGEGEGVCLTERRYVKGNISSDAPAVVLSAPLCCH